MKKYLLLTAIVVLVAQAVPPKTARGVDSSAEEYAVYSAVISNMFEGTQARTKPLVIEDVTVIDGVTTEKVNQDDRYFGRMFPTLKEDVTRDYRARNKEPLQLKESFELKTKYVLVSKNEIDKIFTGGGWWEEFYKRYPDTGGFIGLSRPGFSTAMNQAVVYIQHSCGGLCGTGQYVLLEKSGDRWTVVKQNMVWIS